MTARQLASCAMLLLVLGALGVQQWAAHTHWLQHLPSGSLAAVPADNSGESDRVHDCRWCQIASQAVDAAPPSQQLRIPARAFLLIQLPPADIAAHHSPVPAWNWQSRGPPSA
jgi:hypothetical protein